MISRPGVARLLPAIAGLLAVSWTNAQEMRVPILGWIAGSQPNQIRAVYGSAGASTVGDAIDLQEGVRVTAVSSSRRFALVISEGRVSLLRFSSPFAAHPIDGIPSGALDTILSSGGNAAAVLSANEYRLRIITGLPDRPEIASTIDLTPLRTAPAKLAITDDGELVLALETNGTAVILGRDGELNRLSPEGLAVAGIFLPEGHDVVLASSKEVARFRDVSRSALRETLLATPASWISVAPDGRNLITGRAGSSDVTLLSLPGGSSRTIDCRLEPQQVAPLTRDGVFSLAPFDGSPLRVLESKPEHARVLFAPPGKQETPE